MEGAEKDRYDLVLQGDAAGEVGLLDLVTALHRVGPCNPDRAGEVPEGLHTDPWLSDPSTPGTSFDATEIVRNWFRTGGLSAPIHEEQDGRWVGTPRPPVGFADIPAVRGNTDLSEETLEAGSWEELSPWWADRAGTAKPRARTAAGLALAPRHAWRGAAWHDALLATAALAEGEADPELRRTAAWGVIDPALLVEAALARHRADTLALDRVARTWRVVFREVPGALPGSWGALLGLASALAELEDPPPGLGELFRALATGAPTSGLRRRRCPFRCWHWRPATARRACTSKRGCSSRSQVASRRMDRPDEHLPQRVSARGVGR